MIGTLIKIDNCTIQATHGRYARLCILVPLGKSFPTEVLIETHMQQIFYEDTTPLCKQCGCLGHTQHTCSKNTTPTASTSFSQSTPANPTIPKPAADDSP